MAVLAVHIDILDITNFDFVALQRFLTIFTSTFVGFGDEVQMYMFSKHIKSSLLVDIPATRCIDRKSKVAAGIAP